MCHKCRENSLVNLGGGINYYFTIKCFNCNTVEEFILNGQQHPRTRKDFINSINKKEN